MRIKWTSIHSVLEQNTAAPWVGPGLVERLKREAWNERLTAGGPVARNRKREPKGERALAWFRRSR
jgi:hypothetical protein